MHISKTLALSLLFVPLALAEERPLHGIEPADMDATAHACDNFFDYANGGWRGSNPIPPSMVRWSRRWAAGETTKDVLRDILEDAATHASTAAPKSTERLIGDYYGACMDEDAINKQGATPIAGDLRLIDGIRSIADLQKAITHLHQERIFVPFALTSSQDSHNPTQAIADSAAAGLGLPDRDYYFKDDDKSKETRQKYLEHASAMLQLAGATKADADKAAATILRMETAFAGATLTNVELRDPYASDHKTSIAALQALTPSFRWDAYLSSMGVASKADLNVDQPKFLTEVERQLKGAPLEDWRVYLRWHVLRVAAPALSTPFVAEDFAFNQQYLNGAKEMKPRWKRCAESTDRNLGEALGKKYVEKTFPPEAKARMQELVKNILLALKEDLETVTWMSEETRQKALVKLSTFNPKVGYPDKWKDYSSVAISRQGYWANVVEARRFAVRDDIATIGKPVDRGIWGMTTPTSNAYYNPLLNEIVFPAGILLPPLFDVNASDAVNYGGIGPIIGHEISHGFDDQGAQFDSTGKLENWWTKADYEKFKERGQCVVNQFDGYAVDGGLHENGKLVLGESIGDLGGVKLAYRAFLKAMEGKPRPPDREGFTPEQQFFIAWGQARGDAIRPEAQRQMVLTDPHPIGKYRVIGPLSNLPEFRAAFSCHDGDAMVRPQAVRCEVW
jgi:endothelin-converting enzyme/putative endopeptidase